MRTIGCSGSMYSAVTNGSVTWPRVLAQVEKDARSSGFDLVGAVRVGAYNRMVAESARIADLGNASHLALVIGNTRAMWPVFVRYLQQSPEHLRSPDPLDRYVESCLSKMFAKLPVRAEVRWAHKPEPAHVSMQTFAHIAGIGYKSDSNLSVHPVYGPWIALRAIAVLPVKGPSQLFAWGLPPCTACSAGCKPALSAAIAGQSYSLQHAMTRENWESWLAVRDACPLGKAERYSEEQIRYHYTKDTELLESIVAGRGQR